LATNPIRTSTTRILNFYTFRFKFDKTDYLMFFVL
jgi:hypothetical protein